MATEAELELARKVAANSAARGESPTAWFDHLYCQADGKTELIPWAKLQPNPNLTQWLANSALTPGSALVVGCGLGDDAEHLSSLGWSVVAFDISPQAIEWAKKRFPQSKVEYQVADLFKATGGWSRHFDLVVEIFTVQALPHSLRQGAIAQIAEWVREEGRLFLYSRGRGEADDPGSMPWPLTERELGWFESSGLVRRSFEDFFDDGQPPVRRFRAVFQRSHL